MGAYGLQSHIWNNHWKSAALLAGFPVLLCALTFALFLIFVGLTGDASQLPAASRLAIDLIWCYWPIPLIASLVWFSIAWFSHSAIIAAASGAKRVERRDEPEIYNELENLCIERGITMPRLAIIETSALNAFASGLTEKTYTVTVTRGLMQRLDRRELRAVLAHELTHIRNRDVRLMVIAAIFVGIFTFLGEILFRSMFRVGHRTGGYSRGRNGDSRGGGIIILVGVLIIVVAAVLAVAIRFALSRKREYLADAGAVDLTRDPDAMISALRKISQNPDLDAPDDIRQMAVHNTKRFAGLFATHPPIDKRVEALVDYAGGLDLPVDTSIREPGPWETA